MNKKGPIIVIEDDPDDRMLLAEVFQSLDFINEIIFFEDGKATLDYLNSTNELPFLILSDINLPVLNGFELRDKILNDEALALKCIPYLFFTTAASKNAVIQAYSRSVQGFFVKPSSYTEIKKIIKRIVEYWQDCYAPNNI